MSHCPAKTERRPHTTTATMRHEVGQIGAWSVRRDEDLLAEYVEKETREAFEELVHRYERKIHSYLTRYLRNAELAEDASQATFLQAHLKCRDFDPRRRFQPWLYRIATNGAIDLLRRSRRHNVVSLNTGTLDRGSSEGLTDRSVLSFRDADPSERLVAAEDHRQTRSAVEKYPSRLKRSDRTGDVPGAHLPAGGRHAGNPAGYGEEPNARGRCATAEDIHGPGTP